MPTDRISQKQFLPSWPEVKRGARTFIVGFVDVDADVLDEQPADVQLPFHGRQQQRAVPDAALVPHDGRQLCAQHHITIK